MLRLSVPSFSRKWGAKNPLKAPRRNKEYKFVYSPHLRSQDKHIIKQHEEKTREKWHFFKPEVFEMFESRLQHATAKPEYRPVGLVDPFLNELYLGRLNVDWLNPFPTLDNEHEALTLTGRRGDLMDELAGIEEVEEDALEKLKRLNILNLDHHFDIGGQNMSEMEALHLTEIVSKDLALLTTFRFLKHFGIKSMLYGGSDELIEHYMEDLTSLKRTIGFCLSEGAARSDISAIQTRAWKDPENEGVWKITGKKTRVLVHPNTDLFVVFAQTQKSTEDTSRLTSFLVDLNNCSGDIEVVDGSEEIDIEGLKFCTVVFSDVSVPETHILGELGEGFHLALVLQALSRYSVGAEFAEIQRVLLQYMARYCHYTEQFGKKLEEFPLVQRRLSEMAENVYVCESMAYLVAGKLTEIENGSQFGLYASECAAVQLKSKELALESVNHCLELLGTRALAPNGKVIFDQLFKIYASASLTGSSDLLGLYIGQSGFQFRFHFDKEMFTGARGGDPRDGIYRRRKHLNRMDQLQEVNNFTDDWKDSFTSAGNAYSIWSRGLMRKKVGGWRAWGRNPTNKKIEGVVGGRYSRHGQWSMKEDQGWLEGMLGSEYENLVVDVDDFGKRIAVLLNTHGYEIENYQITVKRSSDIAVNLFAMSAVLSRCNKSARLGYNHYEDEISLCNNIIKRFMFKNKVAMHEFMPWNQRAALIDANTEHIGRQVVHNGGYQFQPAVALKFNWTENPEYLDKLETLRTLGTQSKESFISDSRNKGLVSEKLKTSTSEAANKAKASSAD